MPRPFRRALLRLLQHQIQMLVDSGQPAEQEPLVLEPDLHPLMEEPLEMSDRRRHGASTRARTITFPPTSRG